MSKLYTSIIVEMLAVGASIYFFLISLPGPGILFAGVALINIINYLGRRHEHERDLNDTSNSVVKKSKPISVILLLVLGIPAVLGFLGNLIGTAIEQATLGYIPGFYGLGLALTGAIVGLVVGSVLAVK